MRIGLSTGYTENYWGDWFTAKQLGGSENIVVQLAREFAKSGHETVLRLPYETEERVWQDVLLVGVNARSRRSDVLYSFDEFDARDSGTRHLLVACRSDPPPHTRFDDLIFLSAHHARVMGHPGRPHVGGGVHLADYALDRPRIPRRVICCSSPDRCPSALAIGKSFDFVHSYKKVGNYPSIELTREKLVDLQQTAKVLIHPLAPRRPSEFFSMAVLEGLAAGTPVVVSDADAMRELWSEGALVLPGPIDLGLWHEAVSELLENPVLWRKYSRLGRMKAKDYDWPLVAQRYLALAS